MILSYEEEKNRRQVPKIKEFLSTKKYCDIVYCYLQVISQYDEINNVRYVLKKDCKFTKIGEDLDLSRQTVAKKIKNMLDDPKNGIGLIHEERDRYILLNLEKEVAELVPFSTIRILANTVKERVISVFIYLLVRYRAEKEHSFIFTLAQIKRYVGIGESRGTDYIITDILLILSKLDLLKYELRIEKQEDGNFRSVYYVIDMNNKIDDPKDTEIKFGSTS